MAPPLIPLAELHLHIEGTLQPELIFELAERNGMTSHTPAWRSCGRRYEFSDLQSFLDLYYANMAVLQTEADFADMTRAYLARAAAAGVRHAEIMMDPQAHMARGMQLETCVNGVASALATSVEDFGISTLLIAAFLRDLSEESALEVLDGLLAMNAPIAAIGLDSAEVGNPPAKFERLFAKAREAGLRRSPMPARRVRRRTLSKRWTSWGWNASTTASGAWKIRISWNASWTSGFR